MQKKFRMFRIKLGILLACTTLLVLGVIQGSMAWLMTETDPIVNIFTYGDIQLTLEETTGERYKMTPGKELDKDPILTVLAESEDCWLFVRVEESEVERLSDYIEYEIAEGWTALPDTEGVYYRSVDASEEDMEFHILKDDKVKVKGSVTKEMLEILDDSNYPTLTFQGYAVQRDASIDEIDTPEEAWSLVP